jgi:uncharacterized protein
VSEQSRKDRDLDEALEETFPASDPPANTVETGIRTGASPAPDAAALSDNRDAHRFEMIVEGGTAFLDYTRTPDSLVLLHTEVPLALRGRGIGTALVKAVLDVAAAEHSRVIPKCPFVKAYLRKHPRVHPPDAD